MVLAKRRHLVIPEKRGTPFFDELLTNWQRLGSFAPSSRHLARAMLASIDFASVRTIIELGPGTGPFTRKILKRMHPECTLTVYELSERFCKELSRINDPRLKIVHASAAKIQSYSGTVDVIVSGLPIANFPPFSKIRLLTLVKAALRPGGQFIQFQYTLESRRLIERLFGPAQIEFVLYNVPPAFVYRSVK